MKPYLICNFLEAIEQHKDTCIIIAGFVLILASIIFERKEK